MGHIVINSHIEAPPERVFEVITDPQRLPEWQSNLVGMKEATGPLDRVGASSTGIVKVAGRQLEGRLEVTRVEKPTYLELAATSPLGGQGTSSYRIEPAGGGTDLTFDMEYEMPGGFLGQFASKLFVEGALERDFKHSVENLKAICEAEVLATAGR